jgi:hypothetical protein
MSYAKAARDIIDLLEGPALNEVLFAWLAERLARLKEDDPTTGCFPTNYRTLHDADHC